MREPSLPTADQPADDRATRVDTSVATGTITASAASTGERYQLREKIAHGGMGIIYRAIDTTLGREVVIKVLQDKYNPESGVARRFGDEARITAQLQHPAIPPVHDLGTLPDGRLFLAMKLIKGQTLDDLLAQRSHPSDERGRFVAVFEQVCQAVAYAHAHGVLHRDLKPANVMVGAFGEVQLMDWGLAKVLASRERPRPEADAQATRADTAVVSLRDSDGSFTQAGSVLGTPAFMPPEQAAGVIDKVDQRSDVFGLGAVLAVILTGKPPFAAASAESTRGLAALGDVADCFARLDGCGAEPEWVALCKRCLHPKASERPADGGEVAGAVAQLRQEAEERAKAAELEWVRAEGERLAAELRADEERKRRRVQRALAAAVVLLLVGGLAFGWWHAEQGRIARERLARNAEAVAGLLDQCKQALCAGDAATAGVMLEAAQKRADEGGIESEAERLTRCWDDLAALRDLDAVDRFRWTWFDSRFPKIEKVEARYHEVLDRFGADPDAVGVKVAAARIHGSAVRERLVAALDRLLWTRRSAAVRAALESLDPDPFRAAVRAAVGSNDGSALARLVGQPEALTQPPGFAAFLADHGVSNDPQRQRALLRTALQRRPGDLGLLMGLGRSYPLNQWEGAQERVRWFQAAVTAAPANPATHINLGLALHDTGDLDGAIAAHRETIRLDPKYPLGYNDLGWALQNKGNLEGAIAAYQKAIQLDPMLALPHDNLGEALQAKGDLEGALAAHKEALRVDPTFAWAYNNLGLIRYYTKDLDAAIPAFQRSIQLDATYAKSRNNLGLALEARGNLEPAIAAYREAVRLDSRTASFRDNLGRAQRMRELLPRLPNVLTGKDKPKSPAEACDFATLGAHWVSKHYAGSVRLFADAFTADPKLMDDRKASHRYNAACSAALAGCGKGADAPREETEKARLRGQALTWLRADLTLLHHQASFGEKTQHYEEAAQLSHWLIDSDLAGVRPGPKLIEMSAEERDAWDQLWAEVKATLVLAQRASTAKTGK